MKPERWQQIQDLYHAALEREPGEQSIFLDQACAGDEALREEIESLLAHHQQAGSFIETPVLEKAQVLLEDQHHNMVGRQVGPIRFVTTEAEEEWGKSTWPKMADWSQGCSSSCCLSQFTQDQDRVQSFQARSQERLPP